MATFDYNPITGNLDLVGSGASYIDGVVADSSLLPTTLGSPALDSVYLAKAGSGLWLISRKPAGLYVRTANNGVAADWTYLAAFPEVNADGNWELYNSADPTKELKFNLSGITTGTTRTLTAPNANGTLGWLQSVSSITVATDHQLTAARNQRVLVNSTNITTGALVYLPATGNAEGDRLEVACVGLTSGALTVQTGQYDFTVYTSMGLNTQRTFIYTGGAWTVASTVESHGHSFSEITGNLSISENNFRIIDGTRQLAFDASSIGVGTTRTLTAPNASGTIALTSDIPAAGIGGSTGSTNQAVLRASGTGGSTAQSSDLIVDDSVVAFACTGDASTDIITAIGHNFTNNQIVRFQSLTGGNGLFAGGPGSSTNYFVRNIVGNTFQVSTTSGGSAFNFSTNITAGAILAVQRSVTVRARKQAFAMTADAATDVITATGHTFVDGDAVNFYNLAGGANLDEVSRWFVRDAAANTFKVSNSLGGSARDITTSYTGGTVELEIPFVLGASRFAPFILGDKPDGTIVGGNVRGYGAVDLQTNRNGPNAIASGSFSFIGNGQNNTASGLRAIVAGGSSNTASNTDATVAGGDQNTSSGGGTFTMGYSNVASAEASAAICGRNALADRANTFVQATGRFGAPGDAQTVRTSLRNKTSTATAVELQMGFSLGTRFTIPSGKTMSALINIIAATSGGEFANRYVRAVTIANRGGTTALRGAIKDIDTEEQIGGADISITADDTNDALRIEFSGVAPVTGCTAAAATDIITKTAHGYSNNDDIVFTSLTGGAGLTANTVTYWVINANANDFQVSATRGGAAVNITTDYTDMTAARLFRVVAGIDAVEVGHGT